MLIKTSKPICVWKSKTTLGEGTLWVPSKKSIFFVDIKKKNILILNLKTRIKKIIKLDKNIGFLAHVKNNIFVLGLKSELRVVDLKTKKIFYSIKIEKSKPYNRINDGKVDPVGRLWFGTMHDSVKKESGSLYCLDKRLKLYKVDSGYFVTNGPAFIDKNNFYHTDSRKKKIYKIKINENFKIIKKSIFINFKNEEGSPDGMSIDTKNNLWVCHYGGSQISVFNPNGKKIHKIEIPAKNITNLAFGDKKLNCIFISTALKKMSKKEKLAYPLAGGLFKLKTNTKGKKIDKYKLTTNL